MPDYHNEDSKKAYEKLKPFDYAQYDEKKSGEGMPKLEPFVKVKDK